ncbi:hypothetical protein MY10362_003939 [Beauveria mimosiformis]
MLDGSTARVNNIAALLSSDHDSKGMLRHITFDGFWAASVDAEFEPRDATKYERKND